MLFALLVRQAIEMSTETLFCFASSGDTSYLFLLTSIAISASNAVDIGFSQCNSIQCIKIWFVGQIDQPLVAGRCDPINSTAGFISQLVLVYLPFL